MTSPGRIESARLHLISCVGVDHDLALLERFIAHYLELGVPACNCHLILNASRLDDPKLVEAKRQLAAWDITPTEQWIAPYTSADMWQRRRDVQRRCVPADDWLISADVDEFHEYPTDLGRFLAFCEANRINCVDGVFVDRLAADGTMAEVDATTPLAGLFPEQRILQGSVFGFGPSHDVYGSIKMMAVRGRWLLGRGGHAPIAGETGHKFLYGRHIGAFDNSADPAFRARFPTRVHHFKWTSTLADGLSRRVSTAGASLAGQEYGRQILSHLERGSGRIALSRAPRVRDVPKRGGIGMLVTRWIRRREKLRRKMRKRIAGLTGGQAS
ncbi:glycosyltransferase family 2 protein [Salinisphaera sp. Q1T1-3]|uniref:glycosyltransferase family 2 protein n=1 Tax=Salinisphaera sp. Q1T1-3 TaxID=2321229 RepID=UPI000E71092A|nr:glycosyltransferase family 2 protein [Salinisphaera sp. Q1T1-3]RJS94686.1 hypothetical protein D3260_02615 [Salinisphaera sp. Q1T1-3]